MKEELKCPHCKNPYEGFMNQASIDEYRISLMCQKCQDDMFGKDYDETKMPVGKCANCGKVSFYQPEICSKSCEVSYMDYLMGDDL